MPLALLKMRFIIIYPLGKTAVTLDPEIKKKASNVANRRHLTGDKTPLKDGVSQKIFQGGKCIVKIYFLGASSF